MQSCEQTQPQVECTILHIAELALYLQEAKVIINTLKQKLYKKVHDFSFVIIIIIIIIIIFGCCCFLKQK